MNKKVIIPILFFFLCLTVQGQSMLGYEVTPARPLEVPKSSQRKYFQQPQQKQSQQQKQSKERIVRLIGYYYQNPNVYNSNGNSIHKVSIKVKIVESYAGEVYKLIAYKGSGDYSWQTCYCGDVYYDKDEEAYYANMGTYRLYFNM
ncbi:MAG: hypothetical protein LBV43_11980 [Prevotella sp.]|jgi:hypothetical protein|nr:hypothetical protein [Prevotella sp.]